MSAGPAASNVALSWNIIPNERKPHSMEMKPLFVYIRFLTETNYMLLTLYRTYCAPGILYSAHP